MSDNKSKLQRRHFLLTVGAGAAATAAVIAGTPSVTTQASGSADDKRRGKGYKETAHVRNYYRTTQV